MQGVKIKDMRADGRCLSVDLRHVLDALGSRVAASCWRVHGVWALGEEAEEFEVLNEEQAISGVQLIQLAQGVYQVIDGVFSGSEHGAWPWVVVQANDSSYYLVHSDDVTVLDAMRHAFHAVSDAESEF